MLDIRREAIVFEEEELMELTRVIIDQDEAEALRFLKKVVYNKIVKTQRNRLKSHLDTWGNPMEMFKNR